VAFLTVTLYLVGLFLLPADEPARRQPTQSIEVRS
jgi:hypothetical protein